MPSPPSQEPTTLRSRQNGSSSFGTMVADNANPIIHSAAGPSRRSKKRFDALDLSDDDEWDRRGRDLGGDLGDEGQEEEIDGEEIYGEWRLGLSAWTFGERGLRARLDFDRMSGVMGGPDLARSVLAGVSLRLRASQPGPQAMSQAVVAHVGQHADASPFLFQ